MPRKLLVSTAILLVCLSSLLSAQTFLDAAGLKRLQQNYSEQALRRGITLNKLLADLQGADIQRQLTEVNRFFNQFEYVQDIDLWSEVDYWATPEEFIGLQRGDCEDFVIAKYFSLRSLGVPDDRLYLTYVKALNQNIAHMVLSYFETPSSIPLILDNYEPAILSASKRQDLLPVYSFNAHSLFLSNASAGLGQALPTDKIKNSKWTRLLASIRMEKP